MVKLGHLSHAHLPRNLMPNTVATHYLDSLVAQDPAISDARSFYGTGEQIGKGVNERAPPDMIYTWANTNDQI